MGNHFNKTDDFNAELQALKAKLEQLDFRAVVEHQGTGVRRRQVDVKQSFLGKLGSLSNTLTQLTRTRRRVEALEDNVAALKDAVISATESELDKIAHAARALVEQTMAYQQRWQRWEIGEREIGAGRSEREIARLQERLNELDRLLRFERLTRQKAFTDFDRGLTRGARAGALPEAGTTQQDEDGSP